MKKIINWTFGSVFRTLGRILTYLALGGLIAFICVKNDIKITQLFGIETIKADTINIGTPQGFNVYSWGCNYYNCSGGHINRETGLTNFGTSASIDTTTDNAVYPQTVATVYSYSFNKSNTYTFNFRIHLGGNNHDLNIIKNDLLYRSWYFGVYGYKNSTEGYIDDYINSASCSVRYDETTSNGFLAQCNVALNSNISRIRITTGWSLINNNYIPYNFTSVRVNLIEVNETTGEGALIDKQTNQLIDNQNNNTNQIITNQNKNTQDIINSNLVCKKVDISIANFDGYLDHNGVFNTQYGYNKTTDYLFVDDSNFIILDPANNNKRICFYKSDKTFISCLQLDLYSAGSSLDIPSGAYYYRINFDSVDRLPVFRICSNGNQDINNSLNDINDTLTDDNISDTDVSNALNYNVSENSFGPFSTFLTLPLTWVQNILASSQSCNTINIPLPYMNNKYLTLPCMTPFWNRLGLLGDLIYALWLCVVGVRIFNGLFLITVESTSTKGNAEELYKLQSWEL